MAHAWDCPRSDTPKRHGDWSHYRQPIARTAFTPLPPLATLTPDERARLVAVARVCEAAWDALAARKTRAGAA
jgi:hypothetical protein